MTQVVRQSNESAERMISRFRRQVIRYGVLKQTRRNLRYRKKPSKRVQKILAIRREKARAIAEKDTLT